MSSTQKKLDFHNDSRKAFPEEAPVIDAVEQARKQVGYAPGAALFAGSSYVSAAPTVIPRAVDIIRDGMGTAMKQATAKGYAQTIVEATFEEPSKRSGTVLANQEVSASLRRLGFAS